MPLVLPGGDYEAALRMAGASNFMEALESGVDRNIRRQGARQQMRQSRDLYDRGRALEMAKLQAELEEVGGVGGAAGAARGKGGAGGGLPSVSMQDALSQVVADYEEGVALQGLAQQRIAEEEAARAAIAATPADPGYTSKQIWYPHGDLLPDPTIGGGGSPSYEEIVGRADAFEAAGDMENAAALREVAGVLAPISVVGDPWRPASRQRARGPAQKPVVRGEDTRGERFYSEGMRLWSAGSQDEAIMNFEAARASGYMLPQPVEDLLPTSRLDRFREEQELAQMESEAMAARGGQEAAWAAEAGRERARSRSEGLRGKLDWAQDQALLGAQDRSRPWPGSRQGIRRGAAELADEGRLAQAQYLLQDAGVSGEVYPPLRTELSGEGLLMPLDRPVGPEERREIERRFELEMGASTPTESRLMQTEDVRQTVRQLMSEGRYVDAQELADRAGVSMQVMPPSGIAEGLESPPISSPAGPLTPQERESLDRALGIEPATPPVSLPEEEAIDLITPSPVASAGALGPSLLGGAISQMIEEGRIPAERVSPPPDERLGLKAAAQVPDDQLSSAIASLSGGDTAGLSDLTGIQDAGERGRQIDEALVELQRRQEAASLADAPTPDSAEAVKLGDYTVKKGDYISKLAKGSGTTTKAIVAANRDVLFPGGKARQYKKGGKTLLSGQDLIFPGDVLRIPTGEGAETGGPAGDVDPRKDAPKGTLAELLEKQGEKAKTIEGLRSALEELQSTQPDKLVNPFQKFGRDIAYLPSLRAVAFAVNRAEQGDFSMINQMAGREVKNYELEGLFADYSGFVSGTKRKASEIYMDRALEAKQVELAKKQRSVAALSVMAQTQFLDAGYNAEEAKVFGGYFATVHDEDPATARKWMDALGKMSKARKDAELKRLKYGSGTGTGRGTGKFSDKEIGRVEARLDKAQGRLTTAISGLSRALAPGGFPIPVEEMKERAKSDPSIVASVSNYERALDTYNRYEEQLEMMRTANLPREEVTGYEVDAGKVDLAPAAKAWFESGGDWGDFESGLQRQGFSKEAAAQLREFFEAKDESFYDKVVVIGEEAPAEPPAATTREELEAELEGPGLTREREDEIKERLKEGLWLGMAKTGGRTTVSPMEAPGALPALFFNYTKADDAAQLLLYRRGQGEAVSNEELWKVRGDLVNVQVAMRRLYDSGAWKKDPIWRTPGVQAGSAPGTAKGKGGYGGQALPVGPGGLLEDIRNIDTTLRQLKPL